MRNRKATRMSKLKQKRKAQAKKNVIWLIKAILKDFYYILVGIVYIILSTYIAFEKAFLKVWRMLPRWFNRLAIWLMIINIFALNDKPAEIIEKIKTEIEVKEVYAVKEIYIEPVKCEWGIYECAIYDKAIEYGLNEEQSKIAVAITKHETGNYTSSLFKNGNNVGGLYNSSAKKFFKYSNIEDGINAYINNLKKGYFDKGLDTIEKIQKKYCPIGAENDPTGLNANWISGVTYYYNQLV